MKRSAIVVAMACLLTSATVWAQEQFSVRSTSSAPVGRQDGLHQHRCGGITCSDLRTVRLSVHRIPLTLVVPTEPGNYEVRYHSGENGYPVLAKSTLVVTDLTATLEAAPSVEVGGTLDVTWTGPGNPGDFISIDAVGAPDHTYGPYAYPATGNPVGVRAPDEPADYLVRYHLAAAIA